jgi:hypothetical protein
MAIDKDRLFKKYIQKFDTNVESYLYGTGKFCYSREPHNDPDEWDGYATLTIVQKFLELLKEKSFIKLDEKALKDRAWENQKRSNGIVKTVDGEMKVYSKKRPAYAIIRVGITYIFGQDQEIQRVESDFPIDVAIAYEEVRIYNVKLKENIRKLSSQNINTELQRNQLKMVKKLIGLFEGWAVANEYELNKSNRIQTDKKYTIEYFGKNDLYATNDFSEVMYKGENIIFTPLQAIAIKYMYIQQTANYKPKIHYQDIMMKTDSAQSYLYDIFKGNSAWSTLIKRVQNGYYTLDI